MDDQIFKNSILKNFENPRFFFSIIRKLLILFLSYNVYKEKMFTIEIEDRRDEESGICLENATMIQIQDIM